MTLVIVHQHLLADLDEAAVKAKMHEASPGKPAAKSAASPPAAKSPSVLNQEDKDQATLQHAQAAYDREKAALEREIKRLERQVAQAKKEEQERTGGVLEGLRAHYGPHG